MANRNENGPPEDYSRREALAALMKYSAAVGGAAVPILSADEAVAQASAYQLEKFCRKHPNHKKCTGVSSSDGRIAF